MIALAATGRQRVPSAFAMSWRQYRLERRMFWRNPSAAFFNFVLPLLFLVAGGAILHGKQHVGRGHRRAHSVGTMADHHDEPDWLERASGVNDVRQEWPAGQGMEHLGQRRAHALTGACRQNHNVHGIGEGRSLERTILACAS